VWQKANSYQSSFYCDETVKIYAFRGISKKNDYSMSYVWIEDGSSRTVKNISMDLYSELGGTRLIDPKVVKIKDEYYVTFNSGWLEEGNNIFIMKVYPQVEAPKKMIYENRSIQERNWAFFAEGDEVCALYQVNPLKILKLKKANNTTWEMDDYYCGELDEKIDTGLTIGTQLSKARERYYFVAHKKWPIFGRKLYMGRLCSFCFDTKTITQGKHWLVHSIKSMLGNRIKTNANLFSCTYFSGLQVEGDIVKLGYGVNDVVCGFARSSVDV